MSLSIVTPGIILGTENYDACVAFYRDVIGLPVWYTKPSLVCLRFGSGYLMIEHGGVAVEGRRKAHSENPTMIRLNVDDVEASAEILRTKGVEVDVKHFEWGTVGTFIDPDGNPCELKDAGDPYFQEAL